MFALEGAFSILVGVVAGFFLVSRIQEARWLTQEERDALSDAVARDKEARDRAPRTSRLKLILHPQVALLAPGQGWARRAPRTSGVGASSTPDSWPRPGHQLLD